MVCYTKVAKHKILAVSDALLRQHGAVSHQVTVALVNGALQVFESDIAFAVTGFAGPKGIGDQYPVGTVFIGIGAKTLAPVVTRLQLSGERQAVIAQASHQVLFFLKEFIHHYKGSVI